MESNELIKSNGNELSDAVAKLTDEDLDLAVEWVEEVVSTREKVLESAGDGTYKFTKPNATEADFMAAYCAGTALAGEQITGSAT
jgi:hypothetical protein